MIFIGSSYLIALLIKNDENHDRAVELKDRLREKRVINDVVLLKTLRTFTAHGGVVTEDLINFLLESNEFVSLDVDDYEKSSKYYETLEDYGACTVVNTMKKHEITQLVSFNPVYDKIEGIDRIY